MKNKVIYYVFSSIILIIIVCFFCLFKYNTNYLDSDLLNKKWYNYNNTNGYYNTFYMDGVNLSYSVINALSNDYLKCNSYSFNKGNNQLNLNCGKKIQINEVNDNYIVLTIDSKKVKFFDNVDDSLNYEFEAYYKKSISEYKKEMSRVLDLIKINSKSFFEIYNESEKSIMIFMGDNCTSVDCTLSLDIIEKLLVINKDVHYVNIDDFSDSDLLKMNTLNEKLLNDKNYYNGIYPRVIVIENKEIVENYEIKCNGFDCSAVEKSLLK